MLEILIFFKHHHNIYIIYVFFPQINALMRNGNNNVVVLGIYVIYIIQIHALYNLYFAICIYISIYLLFY